MSESRMTQDHETIRQWVEQRCGFPAAVRATEKRNDPGLLRIDFNEQDEGLDRIDWDVFFRKFDKENLVFIYQEETEDGKPSRFCKFVQGG